MKDKRCNDLIGDRSIGEFWELAFIDLAKAQFPGLRYFRHEFGHDGPDVSLFESISEYHEIKHKTTTMAGHGRQYGLERRRFEILLDLSSRQRLPVLYTIHDYGFFGIKAESEKARMVKENDLRHWRTAKISDLSVAEREERKKEKTYFGGRPAIDTLYLWHASYWLPLLLHWRGVSHLRPIAEDLTTRT